MARNSVDLETDCPNNHNQTITLSREEFDDALKSGGLEFHCNTCDTNWSPTHEEIARLRKGFAED